MAALPTMISNSDSRVPVGNLSQVSGSTSDPLLTHTVSSLLRDTANQHGEKLAAVFTEDNERWTYREFNARVDQLASGLHNLGLKKGERVGIWAPNCPEWLLTQFATARLGLILVNINPAYRLSELSFALKKVGCRALITAENFKSSDYLGMLQELLPELADDAPGPLNSAQLPELDFVIKLGVQSIDGMLDFNQVLAGADEDPADSLLSIEKTLDLHDPINIQFTWGTRGLPKGATLTHHNIVNNARYTVQAMNFSEQDRLCIPVPFYHCFGMVMGTLGCVSCGACMVVPSAGFDPNSTLNAVHEERCTALYAVPTMFVAMLEADTFDQYDLSSLRTGIMAGAPCPIEVMKRVQSEMNMSEVTIAYGMTETSPVSFQSAVDDPLEKRVSSVGRIHPHVEVKIIDPDGALVPISAQGELCTRGYSVMQEYWDDDKQTQAAIDADGWMHTGDLATIDAEGYCNITGRLKDVIIRGGENVYPREIEDFLYTIPGVAQAQVFGLPDKRFGEVVCVWIVSQVDVNLDAAKVISFCKNQIAHYKIPEVIEFVDELPMTVTGKPQKYLMREHMIALLELETEALPTA